MKGQRKIRGIKGDSVTLTITPDPLDEALGLPAIPLLHVSTTDACGDSCTIGDGRIDREATRRTANVVGVFTITGARRMHAALGALLKEYDRCER
jgi:hypothetical protein